MTKTETIKRSLFMVLGLCFTASGVAVCVRADMGISPITTFAFTLHSIFPAVSLGTFVFLQNMLFLILTFVLLGKKCPLWQLLQIPCSIVYGAFVDFWKFLLGGPAPDIYAMRLLLLLLGIVLVGFGFSIIVTSGVAIESNTAFINALVSRLNKPYGKLKSIGDMTIVAMAAVLSLIFLHRIVGIREGTVLSAILIGKVAGFFNKRIGWVEKYLAAEKQA